RADRLAEQPHELDVARELVAEPRVPALAHPDLDALVALIPDVASVPLGLVLDRLVERVRRGDHRQTLAMSTSEQVHERLAEQLALQVPERDVERRERKGRGAAAVAVPPSLRLDLPPDVDVLHRVAADDELRHLVDQPLGRARRARELRDRLAPADGAIVGLD